MPFKYARKELAGIAIFEAVCAAGDEQVIAYPSAVPVARLPFASYYSAGFKYNGVAIPDGATSHDLPNRSAGESILEATQNGAKYWCFHRADVQYMKGPAPHFQKIDIAVNQQTIIQKGRIAIIDDGVGTRIVHAKTQNVQVDGPCKGLEVWV